MPADLKLSVEHVSKSFLVDRQTGERVHALDDCSLTVNSGEVIALIGSSGCGKTTLLKIIHGLIGADEGVMASLALPMMRSQEPYTGAVSIRLMPRANAKRSNSAASSSEALFLRSRSASASERNASTSKL